MESPTDTREKVGRSLWPVDDAYVWLAGTKRCAWHGLGVELKQMDDGGVSTDVAVWTYYGCQN